MHEERRKDICAHRQRSMSFKNKGKNWNHGFRRITRIPFKIFVKNEEISRLATQGNAMKPLKRFVTLILCLAVLVGAAGCRDANVLRRIKGWGTRAAEKQQGNKIVIGLCMDTLQEERWQKDRDMFVARAEQLGAEVRVTEAAGNDELQNKQADQLITQGVDILVVVPHNGITAASIVKKAHKEGVPVIAYDRIINNSEPDLYISFDGERVGYLQAEYILKKQPTGNYIWLAGARTDFNAVLFKRGNEKKLKPAIERGDIKIVFEDWVEDWLPENARRLVDNALTDNNDDVQAIVAPNDGTAGGAIQALKSRKLAGKVYVSGQDADLAGCQRVVEGLQTMTVYKPIHKLSRAAAEITVAMARGEDISKFINNKINNEEIDVPSVLIDPIQVDRDNMIETVIKDGFHSYDDVYRNVPFDKRPPKP